MKRLFIAIMIVATVATISTSCSSCERKSGRRENLKFKTASDTLTFTPGQIGVTSFYEEFIPYPKFDGGTGMKISFSIGIEYSGKVYEVKFSEISFVHNDMSKEEMRKEDDIKEAVWKYNILKSTCHKNIKVLIINGEVIKITKEPTFDGLNEFSPAQVIWEKSNI